MTELRLPRHGRNHLPGGSDPIPGMITAPAGGGDWPGSIFSLSGLVGYWRLGEGASPYLDTSGFSPSSPANMIKTGGGGGRPPMSQDVTPGLLLAAQDDGAVGFNAAGAPGSGIDTDYLHTTGAYGSRFSFVSSSMSVVARIKPAASALSFYGGIVGNMANVITAGTFPGGWELRFKWPDMTVGFARGSSVSSFQEAISSPLSADTQYTVAASYDGTNIRLYINGALAATTADTSTLPSLSDLQIGGYSHTSTLWYPFYGVIDETAVWSRTLTGGEIAGLHTAATEDTSGWVPSSDGSGGVVWAPPTSGSGASPADTAGWLPLTTVLAGVPDLVWDASNNLIPTYTPF